MNSPSLVTSPVIVRATVLRGTALITRCRHDGNHRSYQRNGGGRGAVPIATSPGFLEVPVADSEDAAPAA